MRGWEDSVPVVRRYRYGWRSNCVGDDGRRLESLVENFITRATLGSAGAGSPPATLVDEVEAVRRMIVLTQEQLREVGLERLRVFRGLSYPDAFQVGDSVESIGRALSSWAATRRLPKPTLPESQD